MFLISQVPLQRVTRALAAMRCSARRKERRKQRVCERERARAREREGERDRERERETDVFARRSTLSRGADHSCPYTSTPEP